MNVLARAVGEPDAEVKSVVFFTEDGETRFLGRPRIDYVVAALTTDPKGEHRFRETKIRFTTYAKARARFEATLLAAGLRGKEEWFA
jgi:hypothetical protein